MNTSDDNQLGVLLETIIDQNKTVLEAVGDIQAKVMHLLTGDEFDELKSGIKVVKAAVTDISKQFHDHERRLTHLEAA